MIIVCNQFIMRNNIAEIERLFYIEVAADLAIVTILASAGEHTSASRTLGRQAAKLDVMHP